ncbi:relaxase/mobilization nuclease domain-containing protein [Arthrobacter sp. TMS2-4]
MKYLVGPGKRNGHTDPHLVTGSPIILSWFDDSQLNDQSAVLVVDEIDLNKRINDVELDQHDWHCSLSLRADERPVCDREWADMAEKSMDDMGFTETSGKTACQWVAVHHGTSTDGNDHIHIVASRVREDGTKWSDWSDFPKAQTTARNLEKQFGLIELGLHSERGLKPVEPFSGMWIRQPRGGFAMDKNELLPLVNPEPIDAVFTVAEDPDVLLAQLKGLVTDIFNSGGINRVHQQILKKPREVSE